MKKHFLLLVTLLVCAWGHAEQVAGNPQFIPANDPNIVYMGRVSFRNPASPAFTYPGVQIRACFEGTSLGMKVKPHSGYFTVELDGQAPFKVSSLDGDSLLTLASGLPDGQHEIIITLAYEGRDYRPEFRGFMLEAGKKLLKAPALPPRKIEFIGNSITCGYGIEVTDPQTPFDYKDENFYYTYAATTARALDAQYLVVAKSGIGIYRNYGDPKTGSKGTCLPDLYDQTLFMDSTDRWDFSRYTPDVVCVNLGTNDMCFDTYDMGLLRNAYLNFIRTLRGHYPKAKIVLLSGVMLQGKPLANVKATMDSVVNEIKRAGDSEIYRFDMSPQDGSLGYSTGYHPTKAQQQKMAAELVPFLQSITGWQVITPIK